MMVSCRCVANVDGVCVAQKCVGEITAFDVNISSPEQARKFYELAVLLFEEGLP